MNDFTPVDRVLACCTVDASDRILLRGSDARDLLHRICASRTGDLEEAGCRHLVFTDDKGALVDAPLAAVAGDAVRLVAGPGRGAALSRWIERWIIVEDARIEPDPQPAWRLGEPELAGAGPSVLDPRSPAGAAVLLSEAGPGPDVPELTPEEWEILLFRAGRLHCGPATAAGPIPLELGWKGLIAFDKGCYIGQEVIARLDTYEKVRRGVATARLDAPLAAGATLRHEGRRCGMVLESLQLEEGCFAWVVVDHTLADGAALESDAETAGTLVRAPAAGAGSA